MGGLVTLASLNTNEGVLIGDPFTALPDKDNIPPKSGDSQTVATPEEEGEKEEEGRKEKEKEGERGGKKRVIDLVQSVVFAGCPFRTGVGFLRDLMVGVPNGYNHRILAPVVLSTFPSIYTFFPKKENSQILDDKGQPIPIDFYEAQDWIDYKLGIFDNLREPTPEHIEHLKNCTAQAKLLRSKLVALKNVNYPPIAVLASHKYVTERQYKLINGNSPVTGMGDNRIINATPPDGIPYKEYETNESHAGLLNDLPIVKQIINDLLSQ